MKFVFCFFVGLVLLAGTALSHAQSLGRGAVVFTFDDGTRSPIDKALPVLEAHGWPATFYIPTSQILPRDLIGQEYGLTREEVLSLVARGHEVGNHSESHPDLTTLSDEQLRREVFGSLLAMRVMGLEPKTFAYPYGAGAVDGRVRQALEDAGFIAGRGVDWSIASRDTDILNLPCLAIDSSVTFHTLDTFLHQAIYENKLLCILIHHIDYPAFSDGSPVDGNISLEFFQQIVEHVAAMKMQVVTMRQAVSINYGK